MRILITGITGYIGSQLARYLLRKHEVYGIVREPINKMYIDNIADKVFLFSYDGNGDSLIEALEACKPHLVYHLATHYTGAHDMHALTNMINSNIIFGAHLLEAMVACRSQNIIYATSVMEHYRDMEYCPLNFYAATKRAFSDLLTYYTDVGMLHAGSLVLSDTYGPGDKRSKILNIIKEHLGTNIPVALSDGQQEYPAVYIDDVINAFVLAGQQLYNQKWENKVFQILPIQTYTLQETVDKLIKVSGLTLNAKWGTRPRMDREIRKTVRLYPFVPDWIPKVSLESGLRKMIME